MYTQIFVVHYLWGAHAFMQIASGVIYTDQADIAIYMYNEIFCGSCADYILNW